MKNAEKCGSEDTVAAKLYAAEAERDRYKIAVEWVITESGGGATYLREGVARILAGESLAALSPAPFQGARPRISEGG